MRGFFYNRCLNFQSVICISFYHPTDTECNCFPRASAIGRIFMTYQEFKENVTTVIQNRLGSNVKVTIQEIIKNNDTHYDGLTILSNQLNISPTIYLNFYFKQYLKGRSLEEICHDILSVYEENKPSGNIDISFFTNYEQVKKRIVFKLINYEQNKNLLQKIPHIKILDLAIILPNAIALDSSTEAPSNWPILWASAPLTVKMNSPGEAGRCSSPHNTRKDSTPPHRDKKPAVGPRVNMANRALSSTSSAAVRVFKKSSAYMTTRLERPSFMAGIRPSSGVMADSKNDSAMARANSMPVQATSRDFWLRIGQSPLSCKQDYYNKVAARADYLKNLQFSHSFSGADSSQTA